MSGGGGGADAAAPGASFVPRVGLDESGKGDYFGPLVAAACALVRPEQEQELARLGVADSKRLSDGRCRQLAEQLRAMVDWEAVTIFPARYNQLYARLGNVNRLLAWAHARALENLLQRVPVPMVVADQFAVSEQRLREALMQRGREVVLVQRHRAEEDLAVAAASVLARDLFLQGLARLSRLAGISLPKGATHVEQAARQVVARGGAELLRQVAKLHFRLTQAVLPGGRGGGDR
ncbi:MAG TPA: ribonuclease HIII [Limnochordales bacterium]